jgi:hypothetical protein
MTTITRITDPKARVSLPKTFASSTVIIEQISENELRIRKARLVPEDELRFREESTSRLSDRDRDRFLALLEKPPAANAALRAAMRAHKKSSARNRRHG